MDTSARYGRLIVLGVVLAAGIGCSRSSPTTQAGVSHELLAQALAEAHLVAARAEETGESLDSLRVAAFERIGIDTLVFNRALEVAAQNPEAFLSLYETAIDLLQKERGELMPTDSPEPTSD